MLERETHYFMGVPLCWNSLLEQPNVTGLRSLIDTAFGTYTIAYPSRVAARDTVGYGDQYPSLSAKSVSDTVGAILGPTNLTATIKKGQVNLTWTDNATNETGFVIERSTDGVNFNQIGTAHALRTPAA